MSVHKLHLPTPYTERNASSSSRLHEWLRKPPSLSLPLGALEVLLF